MRRGIALVILTLIWVTGAYAGQFGMGLTPIFSKQNHDNPRLIETFVDRDTLWEISGSLFSKGAALRVSHLFNKNHKFDTILFNAEDKKFLPVAFENSFSATALEVGIPFFTRRFMVEPFFVNSFTNRNWSIVGEKDKFYGAINHSTPGFGVLYNQLLYRDHNLGIKYWVTSKDSLFDVRYTWFKPRSFLCAGYTYRTYGHTRLDGPEISFGMYF